MTLRFSPRSRGAMIGLMSWIGYASLMFFLLGIVVVPRIVAAVGHVRVSAGDAALAVAAAGFWVGRLAVRGRL